MARTVYYKSQLRPEYAKVITINGRNICYESGKLLATGEFIVQKTKKETKANFEKAFRPMK